MLINLLYWEFNLTAVLKKSSLSFLGIKNQVALLEPSGYFLQESFIFKIKGASKSLFEMVKSKL